ncbi:MAG: hypothetical protein ACRCX2_20755 [Paraclostridium sp.]
MNKIFNLKEIYTSNMVRVTVNDNKRDNDLEISVVYHLPMNIHRDLDGIPHMFEHLVFGDIIDNCRSTDVMAMADKVGCSVNAHTSNQSICFELNVNSFELPKYICSTNAYSRFDISDEGYKFAKKFIKGVISPHQFTEDDLNKEKDIVVSEFTASKSIENKVYSTLMEMMYGYTLLGSNEDKILDMSLREINQFAKSLPKPHIIISYNSDLEVFQDVVNDIVKLVENIIKPPKGNIKIGTINKTVKQDLVDVETCYDFKMHHKGYRHTKLNTLVFAIPLEVKNECDDIVDNIYKSIAINYIFSLSKGSLGEYLREEKGLIYGIQSYGTMNKAYDTELLVYATHVNSTLNFEDDLKVKGLIKTVDRFLSDMSNPTEEQFTSDLRSFAMIKKSQIMYGPNQRILINNILRGRDIDYLLESISFEQNFNYKRYIKIFRNVLESIQIILI